MKDREGDISTHFEIADYYAYSYLQAKTKDNDGNPELIPFKTGTPAGGNTSTKKKNNNNAAATTGDVIDRKNDKPILI